MLAGESPVCMIVLIADHAVLHLAAHNAILYIASVPKVMPEADHISQLQLIVQILIVHSKMTFPKHHEVSVSLLDGLWALYNTILRLHHLSMIELPTTWLAETPSQSLVPEIQEAYCSESSPWNLLFSHTQEYKMVIINTGILPAAMSISHINHHDYHNSNFDGGG
jgi:hypothetical protein